MAKSIDDLTINDICKYIVDMGGIVFDSPYLLNIFAIRNLSNPDSWNDTLFYFYYDDGGEIHLERVDGFTTDPGIKYLKNPCNKSGTAIVCEGWHRRLWKLGKHKGNYEALQQYSPVRVYRDYNRDRKFDLDVATIESGIFGINLHRANVNSVATIVGPHSAGCMVIRRYSDWMKFLKIAKLCYNHGQRYYSLALINKDNL